MKKALSRLLPIFTALALVFTLGFWTGRNRNTPEVRISVSESTPIISARTASLSPGFPVNINTADADDLMTLPGIGEVYASRIIAWRETNGPFRAVEELMNVEGIGEKRMEQLLDLVTIGG